MPKSFDFSVGTPAECHRPAARVSGAALELEFRRETPNGPVTFTTRAIRATY